jgi:hypothetical protein
MLTLNSPVTPAGRVLAPYHPLGQKLRLLHSLAAIAAARGDAANVLRSYYKSVVNSPFGSSAIISTQPIPTCRVSR